MLENYLRVLASHGQILTCQIGMDAYHGDFGWVMTYADLVSLESNSVHVSKLTDVVYAPCRTNDTAREILGHAHGAYRCGRVR